MITALAGGVGAARFLTGLIEFVDQEDLVVVVNTGDDVEFFGLHVSPDVDIVTYTLAGLVNDETGWGVRGDTFECLGMLKRFGEVDWFNLGDRDFATSILRTKLLRAGFSLSQISAKVSHDLGLRVKILPMTDDRFSTFVQTPFGVVSFEEYLVKWAAQDVVLGVNFVGMDAARPAVGVVESILASERVILCPSNPIVSIGSILSVAGIRESLRRSGARKVAVSPIVAGAPVKGPADKLLRGLGVEVSAFGVAQLYADFLDVYIIDSMDAAEKGRIEQLGVKVVVVDTLMKNLAVKTALAKAALEA
ncbi:MAG: 2-phospho-L-lactate transferase [Candidatus Bathyarchaeota archaeon]|nr:2-phospho-L-lactate transferase [Candidatus Termiticorpusculum sp.]